MRRRYEEEEDDDDDKLDEPVAITGRQLRSLTRSARAGLFGLILGVAATGLAVWSLFAGRSPEPNVATTVAPADQTQSTAPQESSIVQPVPSSGTPGSPTATSAPPAATTVKPVTKATATVPRRSTKSAGTEKPVTIEGSSLTPDLSTPIEVPATPAPRDTSGSQGR
jgi:hypothetical protein